MKENIKRQFLHPEFVVVETCRSCIYRQTATTEDDILYGYCSNHGFEFKLNEQYLYGWCPEHKK